MSAVRQPNLRAIYDGLRAAQFGDLLALWRGAEAAIGPAMLGRMDRYYLLVRLLNRKDAWHPWLYERCREVEREPDGCLDLWAREHYKSTIITFAGTIQEIVRDPEITIGIFSHTKSVARDFLAQIKREFENNEALKDVYPEVFYREPTKESPSWSVDGGIIVKRKSNPREATVEGHGVTDGMPTGSHFRLMIFDDLVTLESVNTPEQIQKTTNAWALADNLGARGADGLMRQWHLGTRYSFADTYQHILDKEMLKPRIFPATDNGLKGGNPVLLTPEAWAAKVDKTPSAILACQQLLNPAAGNEALFKKEWLKFTDIRPATLNIYIMCDPASSRKKGSDSTAIAVVGIDAARNKYLLDGYHHKMSLSERWLALKGLRQVWLRQPGIQTVKVGYERYGSTSDLEYFEEQMRKEKDAFPIEELAWPRDGPGSKYDRIQRLEPDFRAGRMYLIADNDGKQSAAQARMVAEGATFRVLKPVRRIDHERNGYSLNAGLLAEYVTYPFSAHDDFLDALSRIYDLEPVPPEIVDERTLEPETFIDGI